MTDHTVNADVAVTIEMPLSLRLKLDEVRIARARRNGGLCPKLKAVVIEALQSLVAHETTL